MTKSLRKNAQDVAVKLKLAYISGASGSLPTKLQHPAWPFEKNIKRFSVKLKYLDDPKFSYRHASANFADQHLTAPRRSSLVRVYTVCLFVILQTFWVYVNSVMRKPDLCMCENKGADQLCSNCAADQPLCSPYIATTIPLLP